MPLATPARWSLAQALTWSHALPVLLMALCLLLAGGAALRRLAYDQAELQLAQAAAEVVREIDRASVGLRAATQLLADRPTLPALPRRRDRATALDVLERFRRSGGLHAIRLEAPKTPVQIIGTEPPAWSNSRMMVVGGNQIWLFRSIPWLEKGRIQTARKLEVEKLAQGERARGLELRLYDAVQARSGDVAAANVVMRRHVMETLRGESAELPGLDYLLSVEPLLGSQGEALGLVELRMPRAVADANWRGWIEAFGVLLALLALSAASIGLLIARRIGAGFSGLLDAARRIGAGDLNTPIALPDTQIREGRALSRTLEDMRQGLEAATERERTQAQALSAILNGVEEAILAVDGARVVRYHNRQLLALTGLEASAIDGQFCGDVLRPALVEGRRRCDSACPILLARSHGSAHATEHCPSPRGIRPLHVQAAAMLDERQVLIVREQSALEATHALRDSILANLAHEFRTPLAGQIAAIELLRDHLEERADEDGLELADAQHRTVLRLSQLVENLLESASVEAGSAPLRRAPVRINEVIDEAVLLMRPLLLRRRQRLELDLCAQPVNLIGDARRLLQVFLNLLGNANKFAPDDSTIRISSSLAEDAITVMVADQGPGLTSAIGSDPFASFQQTPGQAAERQGNGLGLAIVRSIVERHHGRVLVDAQPGAGRIGFVLPLESRG